MPLASFLDVVYVWAVRGMSEDTLIQFEDKLFRPLPDERAPVVTEVVVQNELDGFAAAFGSAPPEIEG